LDIVFHRWVDIVFHPGVDTNTLSTHRWIKFVVTIGRS
jgi:hypothetical protein